MARGNSWLKSWLGVGSPRKESQSASADLAYSGIKASLVEKFSAPNPESVALQDLVFKTAGMRSAGLPREKGFWLQLLNESPFLAAPVAVYADEFAKIGWQLTCRMVRPVYPLTLGPRIRHSGYPGSTGTKSPDATRSSTRSHL